VLQSHRRLFYKKHLLRRRFICLNRLVKKLSKSSDDERKFKKLPDQNQEGLRMNTITEGMSGKLEDHEGAMRTLRLAQSLVPSLLQHIMIAENEKSVPEILSVMKTTAMARM
jgi:hypothetical protein